MRIFGVPRGTLYLLGGASRSQEVSRKDREGQRCREDWLAQPSDRCCNEECQKMIFHWHHAVMKQSHLLSQECCKDTCNDFLCKPFTVPIGPPWLVWSFANVSFWLECRRQGTNPLKWHAFHCWDVACRKPTQCARANQHEVYPDGEAQSFCCEPTCQAYTCDVAKNLTLDPVPWRAGLDFGRLWTFGFSW